MIWGGNGEVIQEDLKEDKNMHNNINYDSLFYFFMRLKKGKWQNNKLKLKRKSRMKYIGNWQSLVLSFSGF